MNNNDRFLFSLIKNGLFDEKLDLNTRYSWDEIYHELLSQSIAAIPADKIGQLQLSLSDEQRKQYSLYVAQHVIFWHQVAYIQQIITDELTKESIPVAVLKGTAAAIYYPRPEYRAMGDIDLVVLPKDFSRVVKILNRAGCQQMDGKNERHETFVREGIHIELHHHFSTLQDTPSCAKYLDDRIFEGLCHIQYRSIGEISFPMLPKVENGLVLLQHISQHLETGLGLRQIMDWMLYVHAELNDDLWKSEFEEAAERIGLKTLAVVTTKMCRIFLGLPGTVTWCDNADSRLCNELMTYVMNHGNFGRKDSPSSKTVFILNTLRNPVAFLRMAQRSGCATWKLVDQYPLLRSFAWIYQIGRWMSRGANRKNFIPALLKDVQKAGREDHFLDELGVGRGKNSKDK